MSKTPVYDEFNSITLTLDPNVLIQKVSFHDFVIKPQITR